MEDYKKTGEDKNYEYYRNDSEVNSDDGDDETYMKILNKRDEFNVKILNKEIKIKKSSLNKIMILSSSEPEEQVLFSLYKTVNKNFKDKIKFKDSNSEMKSNEIILKDDFKENEINIVANDPLSGGMGTPLGKNNIQSQLIQTNNIINIPNENIDTNADNEDTSFRKPEANLIMWYWLDFLLKLLKQNGFIY